MIHTEIIIARDFSEFPFGRYFDDGPTSAEAFRTNLLIPALLKYDVVTVVLDGVFGIASSFTAEAFGGLIQNGFSLSQLKNKLNIVFEEDEHLLIGIWDHIKTIDGES
jgi:hypothetical protein